MSQRFNFDQLRIHCSDDYSDFITTAVLVWDVPQKDRLLRWYGDMTGCAFSPEGEGNVQTARKVLIKRRSTLASWPKESSITISCGSAARQEKWMDAGK